jgi:hypothetical protein
LAGVQGQSTKENPMNAKVPPQNTKPAAAADNNSAESASTSHVMRIDRFTCPVVHLSVFTGRLAIIHRYLETLEGCLYNRIGVSEADGNATIVTVAEWRDRAALVEAKAAVNRFYEKLGFDPAAFMDGHGIKGEFGTYDALTL